jgi:epoxyqueuosine reductase QueG
MDTAHEISEYMHRRGVSLEGFADLGYHHTGLDTPHTFAVSFAVPLDRSVVREIVNGPDEAYLQEYERVNYLIDSVSEGLASVIESMGFRAEALSATTSGYDPDSLTSDFPHKTAATLAGLGWIGKCALLITEEYGSAVRLGTVLTGADLPAGDPVTWSRCGECTACIQACPGKAPLGGEWSQDIPRDDFFDARACQKAARKLSEERIGGTRTICGICISVCPWTRRYTEDT